MNLKKNNQTTEMQARNNFRINRSRRPTHDITEEDMHVYMSESAP